MSRLVDVSGPLFNGMWSYNSLPTLGASVAEFSSETTTTIEQHGFESFRFVLGSLSGTYLETGAHNIAGMPALSDLDCSVFIRPAVICHVPPKQPRQLIRRAELEAHCPPVRGGDALLIECGWGKRWWSPDFVVDGPSFHPDCLPWLLAQPMSLLGVDVPCIQAWWAAPGSSESGAGMLLELFKKNILLLAPLVNLDTVREQRAELIALPLNVTGASGAPCRAILWVKESYGGTYAVQDS